jgi:SAM-dependent methyltransferase
MGRPEKANEQPDREQVFGERSGDVVERIAPDHFDHDTVAEHVARYRWAECFLPSGRLLDVACGTGYGTALLDRGNAEILGAEYSFDAIRFGRSRYGIRCVQADGQRLPFGDHVFDGIVSLETIEHVPDPYGFMRELSRVLRPGGRLVLSTPNRLLSLGNNPYHLREFSLDELTVALRMRSFSVETVRGQHWRVGTSLLERIWGLRRALFEIQRRPGVGTRPFPGFHPMYWALVARRDF